MSDINKISPEVVAAHLQSWMSGMRLSGNPADWAVAGYIAALEAQVKAADGSHGVRIEDVADYLLNHFPEQNHPSWDALQTAVDDGCDEDDCIRAWLRALAPMTVAQAARVPEVAALIEAAKNATGTYLYHGGFSDGQMNDVAHALAPFMEPKP